MGKYDFLRDSAERVAVANALLDEAMLVIKNIATGEVGDPDLREMGAYLGSFHQAWMQSCRLIHRLELHSISHPLRTDITVRVDVRRTNDVRDKNGSTPF